MLTSPIRMKQRAHYRPKYSQPYAAVIHSCSSYFASPGRQPHGGNICLSPGQVCSGFAIRPEGSPEFASRYLCPQATRSRTRC